MAGASFSLDIRGTVDTQKYLGLIVARGEHPQPLNLAIAQTGLQQTIQRFRAQQDPAGKPWVPSMAAKAEGRKTLIDTGHMMGNSFSAEATDSEARWGTNAVQAGLFQTGGDIRMPAREGTVRLRMNRDGSLMRQGSEGKSARLARFAKASHKMAKTVNFSGSAFPIHVIARPFLGANEDNLRVWTQLAKDYYFRGVK